MLISLELEVEDEGVWIRRAYDRWRKAGGRPSRVSSWGSRLTYKKEGGQVLTWADLHSQESHRRQRRQMTVDWCPCVLPVAEIAVRRFD